MRSPRPDALAPGTVGQEERRGAADGPSLDAGEHQKATPCLVFSGQSSLYSSWPAVGMVLGDMFKERCQ